MPNYLFTDNTSAQNGRSGTPTSGTIDNTIGSSSATTNFGTLGFVQVSNGTGDIFHGLVEFTGFSIPGGETVTSALLDMYLQGTTSNARDIQVSRIIQTWTELGSTYNTYDGTNNWNTAGCQGAGTDKVGTPEDTISVGTGTGWYTWDVTNIVEGWRAGTFNNEGLILERSGASQSEQFLLRTREGADSTRPQLAVTTVTSGGVTEIPPRLHSLNKQYSTIIAHRLGGHIE